MNYDVHKSPEMPAEWPREQYFYGPRGLLGKLFEDQEAGAITSRMWPLPDDPMRDTWSGLDDVVARFMLTRWLQMAELCVMHGAGESALIHMRALFRLHVMAGTLQIRREAA